MKIPIFPEHQGPLIFAHRGCSGTAPENTLPAFSKALELGITGIELDIRRCATGELVVIHDKSVDRTTNGTGLVEMLSLDRIRELDAGSWFGPEFSGEHVPLLSEVFALCGRKVYYDIEIKYFRRRGAGIAQSMLALIKRFGLEDRVIISSFNPLVLREFKASRFSSALLPCALIFAKHQEVPFYLRRGEGRFMVRCDLLKPRHNQIIRRTVAGWSGREGYPLFAWTVDDAADARRMISFGVRGIISNFPERLG